jgi:putative ABC transport system ATP-binding protein
MSMSGNVSPSTDPPLLRASDLHLRYGKTPALAGVDIEIRSGEIIALTGKSGSGKTSLLYCLAGILPPARGHVVYRGHDLANLGDEEVSRLRREEFGFVFQFGELVPELTLLENVALPLRLKGISRRDADAQAHRYLEQLGIARQANKRPAQVSGGEAQRAAVARALVHRPRVVFADEPTGSLDSENKQGVLHELVTLARGEGAAVLLVSHEEDVAGVADRHLELVDGAIRVAARKA